MFAELLKNLANRLQSESRSEDGPSLEYFRLSRKFFWLFLSSSDYPHGLAIGGAPSPEYTDSMADKPMTKQHLAPKVARTAVRLGGIGSGQEYRLKLGPSLDDLRVEIAGGKVSGARVRALRQGLELTLGDVAHVLGVSERSVMRKEQSHAPLSVAEGDRAYRLARVADLATELIGDAVRARGWLKTPHRYLGDQTPIAMLDTEIGTDLVIESLYAVAYGGVA